MRDTFSVIVERGLERRSKIKGIGIRVEVLLQHICLRRYSWALASEVMYYWDRCTSERLGRLIRCVCIHGGRNDGRMIWKC